MILFEEMPALIGPSRFPYHTWSKLHATMVPENLLAYSANDSNTNYEYIHSFFAEIWSLALLHPCQPLSSFGTGPQVKLPIKSLQHIHTKKLIKVEFIGITNVLSIEHFKMIQR